MAIKKTFNGVTILKPGASSKIIVENLSGFPLQPTGTVGIIGEATGGEPRVLDILEKSAIQSAKSRYKSGPIADVLELLVNPSNDSRVANGASKIIVYKVNNSTQSTINVDNRNSLGVLTLTSKNYGIDENNISVSVAEGSIVDADAEIQGTIAENYDFSATGDTLILDINGTAYTYTSALTGAAETAAAVIADLNTGARWAPSKPIIASIHDTDKVKIVIDPIALASAQNDYGYISVDATSTADTILGMTGTSRGAKGSRIFTFSKGTEVETSIDMGGEDILSIIYTGAGTRCDLDIKMVAGEMKLNTTCAGAGADDLDFVLVNSDGVNQYTIQELANQIDANANYTCSAINFKDNNAEELDFYDTLEISNVAGILKRDNFDMAGEISLSSQLVDASVNDNVYLDIVPFATPVFFTGATAGTSLNSDWSDGLTAMEEERINIVVPLISKDKGALTIDSINTLVAAHAKKMSGTSGRSERNAYVSKLDTKDNLKLAAQTINSQYVSMVGQQVRVLDKDSNLVWNDPYALACLMAGMQAGSEVGEPITYKLINANDVRVQDGSWSANANAGEMIDAGVTIAESLDTGGFRTVVGNTTYGVDANFVFNRISVVEASNFVAYDLRYNLELVFTGTKARTGTAEAVANFIKNRMAIYLQEDVIVGDDLNDGLGYKNLRVEVQGNTATINISITPVQGIDFILPTIYLADIQQSS